VSEVLVSRDFVKRGWQCTDFANTLIDSNGIFSYLFNFS
jgi:hypothetical protein